MVAVTTGGFVDVQFVFELLTRLVIDLYAVPTGVLAAPPFPS
jgi:hypothetical protein